MDSEFFTAEEVANYLRLPLSTVYKLVQENKIPGFKIGKHWRFRKIKFEEWIKEQESISTMNLLNNVEERK
ncbi:MAG: helix-turn-helix domain-containing protein [Anaerolineaceae bacterium]|nr:helix-turn-helix domain-containing protein [Anaerolineaceae bacterium]